METGRGRMRFVGAGLICPIRVEILSIDITQG
jgi:hypothetical protein